MVHPDLISQILELARLHLQLMERIAIALELMVSAQAPPKAPNYTLPLDAWGSFEWNSIGAVVTASDASGPTTILWRNQQYIRRSPVNKFSPAIFFSRCTGKDERGENQYERLITFKPLPQAEPVPERVSRLVR